MEASDLRLMLTLDALLHEGSVTGAARRLGLSLAATSHALARLRERLGDPLLVRAGREMVRTPRAQALRPQVRRLVEDAQRVLRAATNFEPRSLERSFTIYTTDHVLLVLGAALDRLLRAEAPGVSLRFLPSVADDWRPLRDGDADLSVCLLSHFPAEFRTRQLFEDRFTCAVRRDHPRVRRRLSLEQYLALDHLVVAPLGLPSHVDAVLAERGLARRIRRVVPYFVSGLRMVAESDDIATLSARAVEALAPSLGLRQIEPPLELKGYALHLLWHPRVEEDPGNRFLREVLVRAAREALASNAAKPRARAARRKA